MSCGLSVNYSSVNRSTTGTILALSQLSSPLQDELVGAKCWNRLQIHPHHHISTRFLLELVAVLDLHTGPRFESGSGDEASDRKVIIRVLRVPVGWDSPLMLSGGALRRLQPLCGSRTTACCTSDGSPSCWYQDNVLHN